MVMGKVTEMKPTVIQRSGSGIGEFIGTTAGAIGGGQIGGDSISNAAGAVGGAVLGAIVGQKTERTMARRKGWEVWIAGDDGKNYMIPVEEPAPFKVHSRVKLVISTQGQPISVHADN